MRKPELCGGCQMACQPSDRKDFARLSHTSPMVLFGRIRWRLGSSGLKATLRHALAYLGISRGGEHRASPRPIYVEALGLKAGEWAEVKSYAEICQTLNSRGATNGLKFLTGMIPFCGRRFRVHKRLETLFFEESRQIRKMKNTVLLEGVYCDGSTYHCDRSCFYYWREAWLRRVEQPVAGDRSTFLPEVKS